MITRPKVSSLLPSQVPEFVREDYTTFVEFLQAYYEFVDQNYNTDFTVLKDLDKTLDHFIDHFKNELAFNIPFTVVNERFLLERIKDQYLAKGSEASFKLLFKLLFNKEVTVGYPAKQILRASDGKWNQDVSIFVYVNAGNPDNIIGKIVDVVTPNKIIRIQVDKKHTVEIEVDQVVQISEHIYELFIDRRFFGNISVGDKIRYGNVFDATVLPTTSNITVQVSGKKFKVGELYSIVNGNGLGSVVKIKRVNSLGSIEALEFVKYGVGYATDFTATLYPYSERPPEASQTNLTTTKVGTVSSIYYKEPTNGFYEQGTINYLDYVAQTAQEIISQGVGLAWDGTYNGTVVREFFVDNKSVVLDPTSPAVVKISLNSLTKYPGYYTTNDGFLDDAIYIQDSRYYQAFAYVLKIDERLNTYRSAVKTMVHPAGMALFGEYDIRNEFDTGTSLEFALKAFFFNHRDEVFATEQSNLGITLNKGFGSDPGIDWLAGATVSIGDYINFGGRRYLVSSNGILGSSSPVHTSGSASNGSAILDFVGYSNVDKVVPLETHTYNFNKLVDETTRNLDYVQDPQSVIIVDSDGLLNYSIRTIPNYTVGKTLGSNLLYTLVSDTNITIPSDSIQPFSISKALDDAPVLSESIDTKDSTKALDDSQSINDTTGEDSSRTVPYIALNMYITGSHVATPTDSGGNYWFNPYTDPYPVSNSYFSNDSGNYTEGESAFTG